MENEELKDAIKDANLPQFPDFTKVHQELKAKAKANIQHTPRQQGPWIVCVSCNYPHTLKWVGMEKKLRGIADDGSYIIE